MPVIRPWLPEGAIVERLPTATLASLVDDWSGRWFATARPRLGSWTASWIPGVGTIAFRAGDVLLAAGATGLDALARAMFGNVPEEATAADRAKLEAAAGRCLDDLRARLLSFFGQAPTTSWVPSDTDALPSGRTCPVDLPEGAGLLHIRVANDLLVEWVRRSLPPPASPGPLQALAVGLASQPIRLSALVGRCSLSLREFEEWCVGDVLVLDRGLGAPLDVVVDGRARPEAPCRLVDADDELHLALI